MKLPKIIVLAALCCSIAANNASASYIFEGSCFSEDKALEYWVNSFPTILVGEVTEVIPKFPSQEYGEGGCLANFSVKEWLKDTGPKKIWVASLIDGYNKNIEDQEQLKYCEFEAGSTYIIYGRHGKDLPYPETNEIVVTLNPIGTTQKLYCPPNKKLNSSNKGMIETVRTIIRERK